MCYFHAVSCISGGSAVASFPVPAHLSTKQHLTVRQPHPCWAKCSWDLGAATLQHSFIAPWFTSLAQNPKYFQQQMISCFEGFSLCCAKYSNSVVFLSSNIVLDQTCQRNVKLRGAGNSCDWLVRVYLQDAKVMIEIRLTVWCRSLSHSQRLE